MGHPLDCHPLIRSAPTGPHGLDAEVIDLGRGTPEEFAAHRGEIAGRITLVRHELMFAPGTIHRRLKYQAAVDAGAVGFLIAGPAAGLVVAGPGAVPTAMPASRRPVSASRARHDCAVPAAATRGCGCTSIPTSGRPAPVI